MLLFCPECRTLVSPEWRYCRYCNAPVDKASVSRHPPAPIRAAPPPKPEAQRPSRSWALPHQLTSIPRKPFNAVRAVRAPAIPGARIAGIVVASTALALVVCSAAQSNDTAMFSAEDRYIAALALRSTPEPTPPAQNVPPGPTAFDEADAIPQPADTQTEATATLEPVIEEEVAPPAADDGASDNRGPGNGRGNGRGGDEDDD